MRALTRALQTSVQNFVPQRIGRVEADMAQTGDAGVAAEIAPPVALRADNELEVVASRVAKRLAGAKWLSRAIARADRGRTQTDHSR